MQAILLYFWRLCLLRESPERIPSSTVIALCAAITYLLVGILSFGVNRPSLSLATITGVSLLSMAIEGTALYGLLVFKKYQNRFLSTLIAIFFCNAILLTLLLPINLILLEMEKGLLLDIINILSLVCLFWWLGIVGFILQKAAGISIVQGVVLAFVIELLVAISIRSLFSDFA
jgi:hypothetical protein